MGSHCFRRLHAAQRIRRVQESWHLVGGRVWQSKYVLCPQLLHRQVLEAATSGTAQNAYVRRRVGMMTERTQSAEEERRQRAQTQNFNEGLANCLGPLSHLSTVIESEGHEEVESQDQQLRNFVFPTATISKRRSILVRGRSNFKKTNI